jgi:DNA-binding NtrC family response regulator
VRDLLASRRSRGTLSDAVQHFKKATERLQEVQRASRMVSIVVASPDPTERSFFAHVLDELCAFVVVASSAETFASRLEQREVGLTILDARFGWESLLEMVRVVCGDERATSVMVVADDDPPLRVVTQLIELGVRTVLRRPLDGERLRQMATEMIGTGINRTPRELEPLEERP